MELRHLRYFVAVAEELSFTRAAKRLGINQPPLSLQIQRLEKELGAKLFRRETRGVTLTDAGKLLLEEARVILRQVEKAQVGVRSQARGESGKLIVGSSAATYFHPLIPTIIREYGKRYPHVILAPQESNTALILARLSARQVDVAFIWGPTNERDDLTIELIANEETLIVLPAGHALAKSASAPIAALEKETFVLYPREFNPRGHDSIIEACKQAGFSPKLGQVAPHLISVMPLVSAGFGVSIVPRSVSYIYCEGVTYMPIEGDAPHTQVCFAYRRNDHSPAVQNFVTVARRVVRTIKRT
jgi:DNA-binding transcriptional LysR family regulator